MKKIPLTQGKYALVDDEDYDRLNQIKWHAKRRQSAKDIYYAYAYLKSPTVKIICMHRFILSLTNPNIHVDHINGNGLDNRKANLRSCTPTENSRNRKRGRNATTKFKGVFRVKDVCGFIAKICVNRCQIYLGTFSTEEDAAYAYNVAAKKHFGKFARLNELPPGNYTAVPNKLRTNNTTGYRGVVFHKRVEKYSAGIGSNFKKIHLGTFDTAEEAARAYNAAALKYHGPKARLNEL